MQNILITGAGGPAGTAIIRSLLKKPQTTLYAADMNIWASALYLVPTENRKIIPPGHDPKFLNEILTLCAKHKIDALFPTVDTELHILAKNREKLEKIGTKLLSPTLKTISLCLDKYLLAKTCESTINTPETKILNQTGIAHPWKFPVIVKPRSGSGSVGVKKINSLTELKSLTLDETQIIQSYLPGQEFSVDVLADFTGNILAAVPRSRELVDSGVAIAGKTIKDQDLIDTATNIAKKIGLTTVANIQLKKDHNNDPALLEVNPRFSGAMPLTIASGVDMPVLLHEIVLDKVLPKKFDFIETANVRYLEDIFFQHDEIVKTNF